MGSAKRISMDEVNYNAEISRRIEKLRVAARAQHSELATAARISQRKLCGYEGGYVRWPVFRLRLIADYFAVPVDQIAPTSSQYVHKSCETRRDR